MTSLSPQEIKDLAADHGYVERRTEVSKTLFFTKKNAGDNPTLINVFYTTRGAMTKVNHPKKGYNELWRRDAYDSSETLAAIFQNPRAHTGKGYRSADRSMRGCIRCGYQKKRNEFSKNQWRKGPDWSKCSDCIIIDNKSSSPEGPSAAGQVVIARDCIECDADGCTKANPPIQCSRCLMTYYCSQSCERKHFKTHETDCRQAEAFRLNSGRFDKPEPNRSHMRGMAMAAHLAGKVDVESMLGYVEDVLQEDGEWEHAAEIYRTLLMGPELQFASPAQQRRIFMGLSRCFYEMGIYDKAIHAGMAALEMNRHFPGAHKHVALAQKASGDLDAAKATMTRAVLYEAPWEPKNMEANKALLQETFG